MTGRIKIAYPDVPEKASTVTVSHADDSSWPNNNLIDSSKALVSRVNTATSETVSREYDMGSGNTQTADHLIIGRADLLKSDKVTGFALKRSSQPASLISSLLAVDVAAHFDASDPDTVTIDSLRRITGWDSKRTSSVEFLEDVRDLENWTRTDVTVFAVANPITADLDALNIREGTATSPHRIFMTSTENVTSGETYDVGVYAKQGQGTRELKIQLATSAFPSASNAVFNLGNGTVSSTGSGATSSSISSVGNGWYYCSIKVDANSTSTAQIELLMFNAANSYTGDGVSNLNLFRPSLRDETTMTPSLSQGTASRQPVLSRADNKENWLVDSEDFGNTTYWQADNVIVAENVIIADSGSHIATLDMNSSNKVRTGDLTVRFRFECEYISHQYIACHDTTGGTGRAVCFDIQNGTVDTESNATGTITARTGGGYICEMEYTRTSASLPDVEIGFGETGTAEPTSQTFNQSQQFILYNAQLCEAAADNVYLKSDGHPWFRGRHGLCRAVFDGVDDTVITSGMGTRSSGNSIFIVGESHQQDVQQIYISGDTTSNDHAIIHSNQNELVISQGNALSGSATLDSGEFYVLDAFFSGGSESTGHVDGVEDISASNVGNETPDDFRVGSQPGTGELMGSICEIIIFEDKLSETDATNVRNYLLDKWKNGLVKQVSNLAGETLKGPASQDYLATFTETSASRYWTMLYFVEDGETSKITHGDLYFGTHYDFGDRSPSRQYEPPNYSSITVSPIVSSAGTQFRSRTSRIPNHFTMTWKAIGSDKDDFHNNIAQYWDVRPVWLYSNGSTQLLSEHELLKCWIESYSIDAEAAANDVYTITVTFREDVTP